MRVLHAFNRHRSGGGSDNAWDATIAMSRTYGLDVHEFSRNSLDIGPGVVSKIKATLAGIYAREAVSDFRRSLATIKPDVVHAHELFPLISPWILRECANARIPAVFSCYDYRVTCPVATHFRDGAVCVECLGGREYRAIRNNCRNNLAESGAYAIRNVVSAKFGLVRANVSRYICMTEFSAEWFQHHVGVPAARIDIVPCVIPLPETAADPALGEYAAYAGRFVPEKGIELAIEAARRTGIPLKLAGNEPSHPAIRRGDNVECVLTKTREGLAAFYRGARMLLVPSIWYEVFGIVAAEALSHGVPVIASRIGGLASTVRDGATGLHVVPGNLDDLCEKMTTLWNDDERCRALGRAGREFVREHFSERMHVEGTIKSYSAAIANPIV